MPRFTIYRGRKHETHLPTIRNQKKTHPWLFGAHENTRRPRRYQGSSRQRPCQTRSLVSLLPLNLLLRIACCAKMDSTMLFMPKILLTNTSRYFLCAMAGKTPGLE